MPANVSLNAVKMAIALQRKIAFVPSLVVIVPVVPRVVSRALVKNSAVTNVVIMVVLKVSVVWSVLKILIVRKMFSVDAKAIALRVKVRFPVVCTILVVKLNR